MRQIGSVLSVAGLLAGFLVAISVLSGDAQGRVNLLYLLLLFVFLPIGGLLLSLFFLIRRSGRGLAGWMLELPVWPAGLRHELLALEPGRERKFWLFYQTQLLTLAFAVGGLLAFLVLLLGTDISFVWRSTLLDAADLQPLLQLLAMPWRFWSDAQPDLALLQQSQDYRLATPEFTAARLGQWWKYAIAAQLTYTLLPRAVMALVARSIYQRTATTPVRKTAGRRVVHVEALNTVPMQGNLAPVVSSVTGDYILIDWGSVPVLIQDELSDRFGTPRVAFQAGPLSGPDAARLEGLSQSTVVVMVKAWEPPMGELGDYLLALKKLLPDSPGLILPLDWSGDSLQDIREINLREWRRFCGTLRGWSVLQPGPDEGDAA
ncbi:MAG: DUF2868 domain-containing protein [Gammaproteobacteria bacterium]